MSKKKAEEARKYIRDGRAPIPEREAISKVMSANRGRDTGLEVSLRKAVWAVGIRGYRVNLKGLPGRPDLAFTKQRLAIFVHGCFWHQCPICQTHVPRTHTKFWADKFRRNKERDIRNLDELKALGWRTLVIWECEIRESKEVVVRKIELALEG